MLLGLFSEDDVNLGAEIDTYRSMNTSNGPILLLESGERFKTLLIT